MWVKQFVERTLLNPRLKTFALTGIWHFHNHAIKYVGQNHVA